MVVPLYSPTTSDESARERETDRARVAVAEERIEASILMAKLCNQRLDAFRIGDHTAMFTVRRTGEKR